MLGTFLLTLRKLNRIKRYPLENALFAQSVTEHTTHVFYYGFFLGQWEERKFGNKIDWKELSFRIMFHDTPESITNDFSSNIKRRTPEMEKAIQQLEEVCFNEDFVPMIPTSMRPLLKRVMLNGKDESIEGKILKAADLIDRLFECKTELIYINPESYDFYRNVLNNDLMALTKIDLMSVKYFLKFSLKDLELEKFYNEEFKNIIESYSFDESHFNNDLSVSED